MNKILLNIKKVVQILKHEGLSSFFIRLKYKLLNRSKTAWQKKHSVTVEYLELSKIASKGFDYRPLISIILPTYNTEDKFLKDCIDSIINQTYDKLELCIADDCSNKTQVRTLIENYAKQDSRIKYIFLDQHEHITGTTNAAIKLAKGEFLAFIDHDDQLALEVLYEVVLKLQENKDFDLIYTNEDKIDITGKRSEPCFKPPLDIEYFLSFMYIGHLSLYRKEVVDSLGGLRKGTEGAQDYDLALRVLEKTNKVLHIPKILYHWRKHPDSVAMYVDAKPYAYKAMRKVLTEGLERRSPEGKAWLEETDAINVLRPRFEVSKRRKILVLLFQNSKSYNLESLQIKSDKHEVLISYCSGENPINIKADYTSSAKTYSEFFIESYKRFPDVDFILSCELSVKTKIDFIDQLVEQAIRPEIAAVGVKLEDENTKACLHGGYTIYKSRIKNSFYGLTIPKLSYGARLLTQRSVTAVSSSLAIYKCEYLAKLDLTKFIYKSQQAFEIALSLALRNLSGTILWTPFIKGLIANNNSLKSEFDLSLESQDYNKLLEYFELDGYIDPYYPEGLSFEALDYSVEI